MGGFTLKGLQGFSKSEIVPCDLNPVLPETNDVPIRSFPESPQPAQGASGRCSALP